MGSVSVASIFLGAFTRVLTGVGDQMGIRVLLERSEGLVWRALEPCVAVLARQNRGHTLLGVVNLAHEFACGHGNNGAALNSRAVVSLGAVPQAGKAEYRLIVRRNVVGLLSSTVGLHLPLVEACRG